MAHLISFDPSKEIGFQDTLNFKDKEGGKPATEKELFEAFWIGFRVGDLPKFGKETKVSIWLESEISKLSVPGGSIKLSYCPACGIRTSIHDEIRTIDGPFDLIVENDAFEYLKSCFDRWQQVRPELKAYFMELGERFENSNGKKKEDWEKFLAARAAG